MTLYLPLDLETTGLDPDLDRILEVAWCVTSTTFDKIDATRSFVVTPGIAAHQRLAENDYVYNMHAASGLLDAMEAIDNDVAEGLMVGDIEDRILSSFAEWPDEEVLLLGQSPQGVDRPFIQRWMPRLHERLSYRHFDVRTLMDFFATLNASHGVENTGEHRAANDVEWSLSVAAAYYRAMRTNFTFLTASSLMGEPDPACARCGHPADKHEPYSLRTHGAGCQVGLPKGYATHPDKCSCMSYELPEEDDETGVEYGPDDVADGRPF